MYDNEQNKLTQMLEGKTNLNASDPTSKILLSLNNAASQVQKDALIDNFLHRKYYLKLQETQSETKLAKQKKLDNAIEQINNIEKEFANKQVRLIQSLNSRIRGLKQQEKNNLKNLIASRIINEKKKANQKGQDLIKLILTNQKIKNYSKCYNSKNESSMEYIKTTCESIIEDDDSNENVNIC